VIVFDPDQRPDHWNEIDSKADFDDANRMFDGASVGAAAGTRRYQLPRMTEIDYAKANRYWEGANPTVLGPYMMDGSGFPASAGEFRFRAESRIVRRLAGDVKPGGAVLDLGSGIGVWAKDFAGRFSQVTAVEGSHTLFQSLRRRCAPYPNLRAIHGDVMTFEPEGRYDLVFLGGLQMYLNEPDVIALLRKLVPCLAPGGMILCRESTVRGNAMTLGGDYQVVYRSVSDYERIFGQCGLNVRHIERNEPYVLLQMGCELVEKWQQIVPERFQALRLVGHLTYFGLRLGNPWIARVPKALGLAFPMLENHFFVLEVAAS
jgi:trans-aconitate methyltransferase